MKVLMGKIKQKTFNDGYNNSSYKGLSRSYIFAFICCTTVCVVLTIAYVAFIQGSKRRHDALAADKIAGMQIELNKDCLISQIVIDQISTYFENIPVDTDISNENFNEIFSQIAKNNGLYKMKNAFLLYNGEVYSYNNSSDSNVNYNSLYGFELDPYNITYSRLLVSKESNEIYFYAGQHTEIDGLSIIVQIDCSEILNLANAIKHDTDAETYIVDKNSDCFFASDCLENDRELYGKTFYSPYDFDEFYSELTNIKNSVIRYPSDEYSFTQKNDNINYRISLSFVDNGWFVFSCFKPMGLITPNLILTIIAALGAIFMAVVFCNSRKREIYIDNKDKFINNLVENMRKPLSNVLILSNRGKDSSSKYRDEFEKIRSSGAEMSSLLDKISNYTQIKKDKNYIKEVLKCNTGKKRTKTSVILLIHFSMIIVVSLIVICIYRGMNEKSSDRLKQMTGSINSFFDVSSERLSHLENFIKTSDYDTDEILDSLPNQFGNLEKSIEDVLNAYYVNITDNYIIINSDVIKHDILKYKNENWYVNAYKGNGDICITFYEDSGMFGKACITFSKAIINDSNEIVGILAIDIDMKAYNAVIKSNSFSNCYTYVIDTYGSVCGHPNADYSCNGDKNTKYFNISGKDAINGRSQFIFKGFDGKFYTAKSSVVPKYGYNVVCAFDFFSLYNGIIIYSAIAIALFFVIGIVTNRISIALDEYNASARNELLYALDVTLKSSEAKLEFLSQMSHEIRTPINAIMGMDELILRECDDSEIKDYANNIKSASSSLLALVNSILDFSKIDDGNMNIVPVKYKTKELIDYLKFVVADKAKKKNLKLLYEIDNDLPSVLYGDDVRVRQVIVNLLTNAVKYTETGYVKLVISKQLRDDGFILHVEVEDSGIGILPEDMDKLFQSFKRIDEVRNHSIEGTGLGIPIVSQLLNLMNSKLEVDTEYGKGSNFWFDLKQDVLDYTPYLNDSSVKEEKVPAKKESYIYAKDCKVLVVDDNDINLQVVKGILKRNGLSVSTALSGASCIELLKSNFYDIVFLDMMMPEMNGVETLNLIKNMKLTDDTTKIVALTADALAGAKEEYVSKGFDDYLSKPVEVKEIEAVLAKYLPSDKVEYRHVDYESKKHHIEKNDNNENAGDMTASNSENVGFDVNEFAFVDKSVGLKYCGGKNELYIAVLKKYLENNFNDILSDSLKNKDFEQYRISVHALKSTSLSIGAVKLSELAKSIELRCKEGEISFVINKHEDLLKVHNEAKKNIKNIVKNIENNIS